MKRWSKSNCRTWIGLGLLFGLALIIFLPAIRATFFLDDYLQASVMNGTFPRPRFGVLDLYDFVNDDDRALLWERGVLPWWTDPHLQVRFFRPLSSALLWADHCLFGGRALPSHIHSFAWWAAAVLVTRALYRRLLSPRVALMATIIFALAPCHVIPLGWLANREALVSIAFGVAGLDAYLRWRETGRLVQAAAALGLFAMALAAGEYAVCFGGYVLAFELVGTRDAFSKRAVGLTPFLAPAATYLGVRAVLGYGAHGCGFYADPFLQPALFLAAAPRRAATLLAELWGGLHGGTLKQASWWTLAILVFSGAPLLFLAFRHLWKGLDEAARRRATWLLLGAHLALIPVLAAAPEPRLIGAAMLGVAPSIALLLDAAWFPTLPEVRRGMAEFMGTVALALGFAHFVHAPWASWLMSREFRRGAAESASRTADLVARVPEVASSELFIVRGMDTSFMLPFALDGVGRPSSRWRLLAQTDHVLSMRRDERTLNLIAPRDRCLYPKGTANLFRTDSSPIPAGATFRMPHAQVTILEVGPEGPRSARFEFDGPLEGEGRTWVNDGAKGVEVTSLPSPGFGQTFDP